MADTRERLICAQCDHVHYENPRILVTCFVTYGDAVLLCRRALEPAYGKWAPPAGFLENGETVQEAAARETLEETGVVINPKQLAMYGVTTLTAMEQVYLSFRAKVRADHCTSGPESLDVGFFREQDVPWRELAYPQIARDLRVFFREIAADQYDVHVRSIVQGRPCVTSY